MGGEQWPGAQPFHEAPSARRLSGSLPRPGRRRRLFATLHLRESTHARGASREDFAAPARTACTDARAARARARAVRVRRRRRASSFERREDKTSEIHR